MAKRKRLAPAALTSPEESLTPETKAANGSVGVRRRAPIADVSGEAAMQSAFEEVAAELRSARAEGRMIVALPLDMIEDGYLVRDRMTCDTDEMASLQDSLLARGQQTPVEVVELDGGRYGLISGWRRMQALRALEAAEPGGAFSKAQALVRNPAGAAEAYCAMVEENEIRADLSFYERAHIAVKAAEQGVYPDAKTAVQRLFSSARPSKRSKILAFTLLVEHLGETLRWPEAISEKLGLAIAGDLKSDPDRAMAFRAALVGDANAAAERAALERVLHAPRRANRREARAEVISGVSLRMGRGRVTLAGAAVDAALVADLKDWLRQREEIKSG